MKKVIVMLAILILALVNIYGLSSAVPEYETNCLNDEEDPIRGYNKNCCCQRGHGECKLFDAGKPNPCLGPEK